ncbi:hypothetical protein L208DRAFT_1411395 [Tricholoma matsutake]|nr:hypothetical protein L208DRAFT_1411395 [Tricholoma matsutake 945]
MERLKQALTSLQYGIEEAIARRKEADARSRDLEAVLDARDEEIAILHDRLSLSRRFLHLAHEWDTMQRRLRDNNEKIRLANLKAGRLHDKLQRVENERDTFEASYNNDQAKHRELQSQLDDLL